MNLKSQCVLLLFLFFFYFERHSNPTRYEIKSELSLEEPGVIGPPFNFTFQVRVSFVSSVLNTEKHLTGNHSRSLFLSVSQIQNLGYFPVRNLQLNIEIPEMTINGNKLLEIVDFHVDQVSLSWNMSLVNLHGRELTVAH